MNAWSNIACVRAERSQRANLVASLVLATSVCIAVCAAVTGCKEASAPQPLTFELVAKSGSAPPLSAASNAETTSYRLIDDEAGWSRFWREAFADSMPSVDFDAEFVLCVYQGVKSTGGYEIAVREIQLEGESLRVVLDLRQPRPGDMLIQIVTDPYAIYRVRLSKRARGTSKADEPQLYFVERDGESERKIDARRLAAP